MINAQLIDGPLRGRQYTLPEMQRTMLGCEEMRDELFPRYHEYRLVGILPDKRGFHEYTYLGPYPR